MHKLVPESAQGDVPERRLGATQLWGICDLLAIAVVLPLPTIFALCQAGRNGNPGGVCECEQKL